MKYCTKCKNERGKYDKHCWNCGMVLIEKQFICVCGVRILDPTDLYCRDCGTDLKRTLEDK